jgi:hypothetical protein
MESTRRAVLGAGASALLGGLGAGCLNFSGPTTPNDPDRVGESAVINGVTVTLNAVRSTTELTYVPRGNRVTVADEAADMETEVVEPRTPDARFLVFVVAIENVADEEKRIPTSAPGGTGFTDGRIYLENLDTEFQPVPVDPDLGFSVGGAYSYEDRWLDRLMLAVGAAGGNLAGGTGLEGWILYEIPGDFEFAEVNLVAEMNPEGPARRFTWPVSEP